MAIVVKMHASIAPTDLRKNEKKTRMTFKEEVLQGIPAILPELKPFDPNINHAPKRKEILNDKDKKRLAVLS